MRGSLGIMYQKMNELENKTQVVTMTVSMNKAKFTKRAESRAALDTAKKGFPKYDKDKDGLLSQIELKAYAKGEFKFTLPNLEADAIGKILMADGEKGVPA